jgi:hypothetical protein
LTGKHTILGIFTGFPTPAGTEFPVAHPGMSVYLTLTEWYGGCQLRLQLVDITEEETVLAYVDLIPTENDPWVVMEFAFAITDLVFPQRGEYRVQVVCEGEILKEHRLFVT